MIQLYISGQLKPSILGKYTARLDIASMRCIQGC